MIRLLMLLALGLLFSVPSAALPPDRRNGEPSFWSRLRPVAELELDLILPEKFLDEKSLDDPVPGFWSAFRPHGRKRSLIPVDESLDDKLMALPKAVLPEVAIEDPPGNPVMPIDPPNGKPGIVIQLNPGEDKLGVQGAKGTAGSDKKNDAFAARTKRTNIGVIGGGTGASEAAVARGLAWLSKQQKDNGSWVFDDSGSSASDVCSSTAMSLLPFLAAGQTHKPGPGKIYQKTIEKGLLYLISLQIQPAGNFKTSTNMYSHAFAAIALCELYGMTGDKNVLYPAKMAIDYIIKGQGANGSWGYKAGTDGDTSIVGWQIQALKTAELSKDIPVPKAVIERANKFLDSVSTKGEKKSTYGYREGPGSKGTSLTAVGLLSRYYTGWGPVHPAFMEGVEGLNAVSPPKKEKFNMYYYYYATQVLHFHGKEVWEKEWNPKMRDLLVELQDKQPGGKDSGSWSKDQGMIGSHCGRLGTTCMCLLTLEVYYRHAPLYKRDDIGREDPHR